jgi:hypothetical protein
MGRGKGLGRGGGIRAGRNVAVTSGADGGTTVGATPCAKPSAAHHPPPLERCKSQPP